MSAETLLIHSVSVFSDGVIKQDQWVLISDKVLALGQGSTWKEHADSANVLDGTGKIISPKLVDTHIHGGGGFAADESPKGMAGTIEFHQRFGVGRTFLSLISAPIPALIEQIGWAHEIKTQHPSFLGLHLEGPFIAHSHKGAHDPSVLRAPEDQDLLQILAASKGIVRSITVAPELIRPEQVKLLNDAGIEVCLGHTGADYSAAKEFFANGSKIMTHAFNGMRGIHHRDPGPIPAALENPRVFTELIADGAHVEPAAARLLDPERVILITDAMSATGLEDGDYQLGSMAVKVTDSIARTESGSLAGSTLTLDVAVKNFSNWTGSKELALRAAITNPERAYGLESQGIQVGSKDLLLWGTDMSIERNLAQ